jgi:hypothetical protein
MPYAKMHVDRLDDQIVRVSMAPACYEVDTIFRLWLSGLKVGLDN